MRFQIRIFLNAFVTVLLMIQTTFAMTHEYDFSNHLLTAEIVAASTQYVSPMFQDFPNGSAWGFFQHAPSEVIFDDVYIGMDAGLFFRYGVIPDVWVHEGDGVRFEIEIITLEGESHIPFTRYIDPKSRMEDRELFQEAISLSSIKNTTATVIFRCYEGEDDDKTDYSFDWGFWGTPKLISSNVKQNQSHSELNILLVTIDTLRADFASPYGKNIRTPTLCRLANKGVLFERAFSNSSTTVPSHASLLSSILPYQMGILGNFNRYMSSIPRLPQIFKEIGYNCGASVSVIHLDKDVIGFGDGFDFFSQVDRSWIEDGHTDVSVFTRSAGETTTAALEWLYSIDDAPFFLWVHYYDPHTPYLAEGEFRQLYYDGDPTSPLHTSMDDVPFFTAYDEGFLSWVRPYTDLDYFIKEYKAEISYVDMQLNRLLEGLRSIEADTNTLVIVTADHGEHLGERSIYFDHWTMYNQDLHIPLIFYLPGIVPEGKRVSAPVTLLDVAPTIVDILDVADHPVAEMVFQGETLRPLWEGGASSLDRIHHAQGLFYTSVASWNDQYKLIWELTSGKYHDEFSILPDRVFVFDKENDPTDSEPVASFYWQDEEIEWPSWVATSMPNSAMVRIERTMRQIQEKRVPSASELRSWFASGNERYVISDDFKDDDSFYETVVTIMEAMLEEARPEPLDDLLADVYARWKQLHDERGNLIMDEAMLQAIRDLGYVQ